jgi:hypothetical protein
MDLGQKPSKTSIEQRREATKLEPLMNADAIERHELQVCG